MIIAEHVPAGLTAYADILLSKHAGTGNTAYPSNPQRCSLATSYGNNTPTCIVHTCLCHKALQTQWSPSPRVVTGVYRSLLPPGAAVLELCASRHSHLPSGLALARLVGQGMNQTELAQNRHLTQSFVQVWMQLSKGARQASAGSSLTRLFTQSRSHSVTLGWEYYTHLLPYHVTMTLTCYANILPQLVTVRDSLWNSG